MYEEYWRLKEKPFENTPDPRFIYYSQRHEEALSRMLYAMRERKGAALLTGECGSGKTLLSRVLWQELQQENRYRAAFILNPRLSSFEFVQEIFLQLSGTNAALTKIDLFHALHNVLYSNYDADKHSIIVIDEAQAISQEDIFEELRLLLNFQLNNSFLLTLILLGQPELKERIHTLPQLRQRIAIKYHLNALSKEETSGYIRHRLKVAGSKEPIFHEDSLEEIYRFSGGIPRRINNICDMALLIGYSKKLTGIDKKIITEVALDLGEAMMHEAKHLEVQVE
ncbi:MAG: hypothetical protein A2Y00_07240 [Omnitrophica WOR_2 bacterium GWF2_43_52]|nr:MAG: hypothetical protein A2062_07550 [Omnitrophica WOR_2 bacterium GWA2_44_7]OGX15521.1 MAG: hypothetical protein A2Y01_06240 [Omnitrophica WOR_2 bacterium GWC2_44_8]OGX20214.1 MAG: hypothetical protein A2Y00_07240 [Omnitrophica WOR_2 bacterium GWF2_43_52]OGX54677.1 MAG: hypothetical protein A2460_02150 [Omnitrophica WOR_2 bacterium RIFOXYC2_FULL_43_9]HAH19986.1 ATPase [Candidatus Omnitrophota bacterium]